MNTTEFSAVCVQLCSQFYVSMATQRGHRISLMDHPKETSAFPSNASEVKMPQLAYSVSGKKEHKKKKRSKNRRASQLTPGETSKTEEKNDIHRNEDAEDRESSTPEKQVLEEKQKELSTFWFKLVQQEDKKGPRLPPLDKPHIRLNITVSTIQKYIAQKLNMNDHTEVDVVCCAEKLEGDMTLKDIQLIWMSNLPYYGWEKAKWDLEEAVIELGYARRRSMIIYEST